MYKIINVNSKLFILIGIVETLRKLPSFKIVSLHHFIKMLFDIC